MLARWVPCAGQLVSKDPFHRKITVGKHFLKILSKAQITPCVGPCLKSLKGFAKKIGI